jgi:hypothetical protein
MRISILSNSLKYRTCFQALLDQKNGSYAPLPSYLERRVLARYRRIVVFDFQRPMVREILQVGWRSDVQPTVHPRDGRLKQFYVDFCPVQYGHEHQLDSSGERNTEPPDGYQNEIS